MVMSKLTQIKIAIYLTMHNHANLLKCHNFDLKEYHVYYNTDLTIVNQDTPPTHLIIIPLLL
jgi:hypothetical protein